MSVTRFAILGLAVLASAGCQNTPENYIEPSQPAPAAETDNRSMAELINQSLSTSELNVGRLKDPAKTVGYASGSTDVGDKLLGEALIVDHVTRQDADNHFGVTVTVFNNRDDATSFEWRLAFFNAQGAEVAALDTEWKGKALAGKSWGTVSNSAAVRGAVRFRLEARAAGSAAPPQ